MSSSTAPNTSNDINAVKYAANLRSLQRILDQCTDDAETSKRRVTSVTQIDETVSFVTLYEFSNGQWTKCNIEGTLFVVNVLVLEGVPVSEKQLQTITTQRTQHQMVIMNRTSTETFIQAITPSWELQDKDDFLIIYPHSSNSSDKKSPTPPTKIWGLWFHKADERIALYQSLQSLVLKQKLIPDDSVAVVVPSSSMPVLNTTTSTTDAPSTTSALQISQHPPPVAATTTAAATAPVATDETTATNLAALSLKSVLGIVDSSSSTNSAAAAAAAAAVSPNHNQHATSIATTGRSTSAPPPSRGATATGVIAPSATTTATSSSMDTTAASNAPSMTTTTTTASGSSSNQNNSSTGILLDKKALQLSLLSLLHDDRFLEIVHAQYVRVVLRQQQQQQQRASDTTSPPPPPTSPEHQPQP